MMEISLRKLFGDHSSYTKCERVLPGTYWDTKLNIHLYRYSATTTAIIAIISIFFSTAAVNVTDIDAAVAATTNTVVVTAAQIS